MGEKWCWIELIGFDRERPGYAVGEFLQKFGGKPDGISLLFADIGFVLGHRGGAEEYTLRPCDCAYGNKPLNEERFRQEWTNRDLAGLVGELKMRGIKVLVSFFNFCEEDEVGGFSVKSARDLCADGTPTVSLNVLKRISDGRRLSTILFSKLREVVRDYGFSGVQFADGISSARPSVENGDFSDGLTEGFASFCPEAGSVLSLRCEGDPVRYRERRSLILSEFRYEWTKYLCGLWKSYYADLHRETSACGERVFNSYWTRDPFEAMYRYGIDCRECILPGDRIMVEEVSATRRILGDEDQGGFYLPLEARDYFHYEFFLMQMSLKCALPGVEQLTLTPIKDTTEQWDIIRHSPMELTRAVYRRNNAFVWGRNGFVRVSEGPLYCLSDAVPEESWNYLSALEDVKLTDLSCAGGATLLWSDGRLAPELEAYVRDRSYTAAELHNELLNSGLSVTSMTRIENVESLLTTLFIANPGTLSEEELAAVRACRAQVVCVGSGVEKLGEPVWSAHTADGFGAAFYNTDPPEASIADEVKECLNSAKRAECDHASFDKQGGIWTMPLKYDRLPREVFAAVSKLVNLHFGFPYSDDPNKRCKVTPFCAEKGRYLLLLCNDEYFYIVPKINMPGRVLRAKSLVKCDGYEIAVSGNIFSDRIPPRGMDIVEVTIET